MAKTNTLYIVLLLNTLALLSQSSADTSSICKSTPYPSFCNQVLPSNSSSNSNVYDYGRSSVRKSVSAARKFLSLIENYLRKSKSLTVTATRALEDCKSLAESNIDYLTTSSETISQNTLNERKAEDIQSLLSAIVTNIETCIDGLQATASAWSVRNGILTPLSNDTRLYSVSLALFTKGWVPKKKKKSSVHNHAMARQFELQNGKLNLKMSAKNEAVYANVNGRKMLQVDGGIDDQVLVRDILIVSQDGSGNFTTINEAVGSVPVNSDGSNGYFVIFVTAGVYEEYVIIAKNKRYLMMIGDGINKTIITGNHNVVDGWTTFNSSTFAVGATGFVAVNITFRNTAGPIKHQAVAVRNSADLSTFYSCSFEGYQDTLYVHSLRQFYKNCDIYGTVDFIFGNAAAVFQDCNMYPRLPMSNQFNAITAQGRSDPNQNTGISIVNCTIRAADDLANSNVAIRTYLGRPWKEYSRTVYMQSFLDSVIIPVGWSIWSGDFALNTSYYAEFNNFGPGSNTNQRVTWPGFHIIDATDAVNFTVSGFLLGDSWIPQSGVPFTSGLL